MVALIRGRANPWLLQFVVALIRGRANPGLLQFVVALIRGRANPGLLQFMNCSNPVFPNAHLHPHLRFSHLAAAGQQSFSARPSFLVHQPAAGGGLQGASDRYQEDKEMRDFHTLKVWEKSHAFALAAYKACEGFPSSERFGLTSQLQRAALSIPTNIAEGCGYESDAQFICRR